MLSFVLIRVGSAVAMVGVFTAIVAGGRLVGIAIRSLRRAHWPDVASYPEASRHTSN